MFAVNLRSRIVVAVVGLCAVAGLMAVSVGAVQAGAVQTEEEAKQAEEMAQAKEVYARHMQKAAQAARRAAEAGRQRLAKHLVQARGHWTASRRRGAEAVREALQDGRGRMRGAPRIAIRHRGPGGGGGIAERVLRMAEDLELTEQQESEIRDARRQYRRASIEREAAIDVAQLDLEELMVDPHTADLGAVEQQMQAIGMLRVESRVADLRLNQQAWGTLTAEQRDQLQDGRHNAFFLRGDGPRGWSLSGDDFMLNFDADDFVHEEWLNDFDFDFDFGSGEDTPFGGLWRLHEWQDDDGWHEHEGEDEDEDKDGEVKTNAGAAGALGVGVRALF